MLQVACHMCMDYRTLQGIPSSKNTHRHTHTHFRSFCCLYSSQDSTPPKIHHETSRFGWWFVCVLCFLCFISLHGFFWFAAVEQLLNPVQAAKVWGEGSWETTFDRVFFGWYESDIPVGPLDTGSYVCMYVRTYVCMYIMYISMIYHNCGRKVPGISSDTHLHWACSYTVPRPNIDKNVWLPTNVPSSAYPEISAMQGCLRFHHQPLINGFNLSFFVRTKKYVISCIS